MTPGRDADAAHIGDLLPSFMADDGFTSRFVAVFDILWSDVMSRVAGAGAYFDPTIAPIEFVTMLARWTGAAVPEAWLEDPSGNEPQLRRFVLETAPLFRWRGTRHGLEQLVAAATGADVDVVDPAGVHTSGEPPDDPDRGPVQIRIHGPSSRLSRAQIEALVSDQLPIGVPYEIVLEDGDPTDA